jgi:hypothetical protein
MHYNRRNNESVRTSTTSSDDDESRHDTVGTSGEVSGDSYFIVLQEGPPPSFDNNGLNQECLMVPALPEDLGMRYS